MATATDGIDVPGSLLDDLVLLVEVGPGPSFRVDAIGGRPVVRGEISPLKTTGLLLENRPEVSQDALDHLEAAWMSARPQRYSIDWAESRYDVLVSPILDRDGRCTHLVTHLVDPRAHATRRRDVVNAAIVDALPGSVALLDTAGVIRAVNAGWIRFGLERSNDGVLADAGTSYLAVAEAAAADEPTARIAANAIRSVLDGETDLATADYDAGAPGETEWYTMRVAPVEVDDERWVVVTHEDVTELREARERWRAMFTSAGVPTVLVTDDGVIDEANAALARMLGTSLDDILGTALAAHLEATDDSVPRLLAASRARNDEPPIELRLLRADGAPITALAHAQTRNGGRAGGCVVQLVNVTQQRRAEARLALHRELLELVASGTPITDVALAVAANIGRAIDGASGAVLLGSAAPISSPDLPAMWLPFSGGPAPQGWSFRTAWSVPVRSAGGSPNAAVVVVAPAAPEADEEDAIDLLASVVRLALQRDEMTGVSETALLSEQLLRAEQERTTSAEIAAEDIRRGLRAGEITVHYQPIVDLQTGQTTSLEALVRWHHPERGLVPPPELIQAAETSGLIGQVGELVLSTACRDLARWRAAGLDELTVAVNLSAIQLADDTLVNVVRDAVAANGIEPSALVVEITESVVVEDVDRVASALAELRALGVRVAIDDFGTGYSSLLYLKRFPADVLKVDRAFVQGLGVHDGDTAIVDAVVGLAHQLGLEVVAEGVETAEQLHELRRRHCDRAQGFLLQRPVAAEELDRFLDGGAVELGPEPPEIANGSDLGLDELLAIVSHELSTPLTVLGGHAELLADHIRRQDDPTKVTDAIERSIVRLRELLRSLAGLSGSLGAPGPTTSLDVPSFVSQCVDDLGPLLAQHDVDVQLQAAAPVDAEAVAVRQILTNLLANAVKFTSPGTRIEVTVRQGDDGEVDVAVADHGPGVPVGREDELFGRFARLDSPVRGLGLGLHLSRGLARRQGGDLVHERTPGGGATFVLQLR